VIKNVIFFILASIMAIPAAARGGDILVVQSLSIKPYNDAIRGFKSVCPARTASLISADLDAADIAGRVQKESPDLILAVGMDALEKVRNISDVPIIYLMVLNPRPFVQDNPSITGVSMYVQAEKQLAAFRQVLPHASRVGILYDPAKSGTFVQKAQKIAAATGIELVTRKVQNSRDAATALDGMKGKIDTLWLLPDTSVVNPGTIDLLLLSAIEYRIPVFTFSEKYTEKGALFSLEVDAAEAGRQAGDMANRILNGTDVSRIDKADARGGILSINLIVAKKLGLTVTNSVVRQSRVIK
jgi:putative ABC transport system substrate-binding protein